MAVRIVRLGSARARGEGVRIGTVRRPPRGVPKSEYGHRNFFDVWLPELAPSAPLVKWALSQPWSDRRWATYRRRYLAEMHRPPAQRLLSMLSALSHTANFSVGCYCDDEQRCHRSLLARLLRDHGAAVRDSASRYRKRQRSSGSAVDARRPGR
ncbi:MAG TPA: DUF488 family protein [Candidatus Binatia bacterium]|nr:DUF488 family protein [Candidatus Binatia bacterium]